MRRLEHPAFIGESSLPSAERAAPPADALGGIALFFDVENILLGIQGDIDVRSVVRFLGERGDVMTLRAYADWGRYRRQQRQFLEEGVQMVFLPTYGQTDKNRTDTAICVDAMEILFTRPQIETFCIVSGDSDFSILAQRLRDHGRRIIGVSAKSAASPILVKQCHEFVFYETLVGQRVVGFSVEEGEARLRRALERVVEEHGTDFHASVLKDWMRKQDATFSERNYGAGSFTRFLANYDHLVTIRDGGLLHVEGDQRQAVSGEASAGASPESKREPGRYPALGAKAEAEARNVLLRTIIEATGDTGGAPVPLSRLKDTMQAVAPAFDEWDLGFKTFTQFLLAFPDIVVVDRASNTARPNEGIVPALTDRPGGAAGPPPSAGDRRRRPKTPRAEADTLPAPPPPVLGAAAPVALTPAPAAAKPEPPPEPKPEPKAEARPEPKAEAKPDKPERSDKPEKPEKPEKPDRSERVGQSRELPLVPVDAPTLPTTFAAAPSAPSVPSAQGDR
ncbi:MAG: NYN domain-containing protein [Myxococcota bacterium]